MREIEKYIETYFGIGGAYLNPVSELFKYSTLEKGEYFLRKNQYSKKLSFIKAGYLRIFAPNESGDKEITQWVSSQGMFITELSSLLFNTPSRFNIQALTDCELYTISQEDYKNIKEYVPNWPELEKLFISKCFITLENRVFEQISMSAEQKVSSLMENNSDIFLYVPLQYIASMLGITPETLSRVRRKMIS
jgi:CRP-like cAMP-binding protein